MNSYNEDAILADLKHSETQRTAFAKIVEHYSQQLYQQIRHMVLSHDDANDILQNTFIKAWRSIDYFRAEAKLSTWLYRIAMNECLTFLAKKKKQHTVSIDNIDNSLIHTLKSDPYFSGDDMQFLLQEALHTLPDKQRMVFNMKYFQDMKYQEISEIVGTTTGALKASYHHAVKKVKEYLEQHH
jgi:RNA polymerase sigma-70 factor (ECF subfamily)